MWHRRLRHMSEKEMKVMLSKDKLSELKSINLDFSKDWVYKKQRRVKDCVYGKQRRVSFSKTRKTLKAERLKLIHANVWSKDSVPSLRGSLHFATFIDD